MRVEEENAASYTEGNTKWLGHRWGGLVKNFWEQGPNLGCKYHEKSTGRQLRLEAAVYLRGEETAKGERAAEGS